MSGKRVWMAGMVSLGMLAGWAQTEVRETVGTGVAEPDSLRIISLTEGLGAPTGGLSESFPAGMPEGPWSQEGAWRQEGGSYFLSRLVQQQLLPYREPYPVEVPASSLAAVPGQASLGHWKNGEVIATGSSVSYPGMMKIDSGSVGVFQTFGNFNLYLGATANKYGWYRGLHTQYGVDGSLTYNFAPRWSATVFGTYYFGRAPMMPGGGLLPPSMLGYFGYNKFGGYVDYDINERFGVMVGGQAVKPTYSTRYEAEPIVTPYVKLGKKVKVGLPVGQIVNEILRDAVRKR